MSWHFTAQMEPSPIYPVAVAWAATESQCVPWWGVLFVSWRAWGQLMQNDGLNHGTRG